MVFGMTGYEDISFTGLYRTYNSRLVVHQQKCGNNSKVIFIDFRPFL